jgi:D-alanine-D-alanine ligase
MAKKKILVVLGGNSREREISLKTGKACIAAIKKLGHKVEIFDPKKKSFFDIKKSNADIIFNALHGEEGEDGYAQSFFEFSKIPYTHSGVISSMNAMNKLISKKIFIKNKILTPKYEVISKKNYNFKNFKKAIKIKNLKFPMVIKPNNEGSSIGVKICKNLISLKKSINILLKIYDTLIIENFIGGQEIQVAVLNGKALGAIELKPKRKFYDYKAKYTKSAKTDHIMPANILKKKYNEVLKIAQRTHKILGCRGVTRSDFKFINNKFYLLETNTQPGMTDLSLVPEIASYKKISFKKLVQKLILDASLNK